MAMPGPTHLHADPRRDRPAQDSNEAAKPPRQGLAPATPVIIVGDDEERSGRHGDSIQAVETAQKSPSENGVLETRLNDANTMTTTTTTTSPPSLSIDAVTEASQSMSMPDMPGSPVAPSPPAFNQPEVTVIELVSTSATASAFPESFGLAVSQRGQWIAAYTSTALHILRAQSLPQVQGRFFKVRRKPIAMAISDEPQSLAILSNPHNVDVYSKSLDEGDQDQGSWMNLKQRSIIFGHEITTIALSPDAKILAAGYRGGVEIVACALDASDNQRRQISCEPMAEIAFSYDGRTLLATSTTKKTRPTTIISVGSSMDGPMTDDGVMESLPPEKAWISQLLFPERAINARQAAMLPDHDGVVAELLAFNAEEDTWGLYDVNMKQFTERKLDVLNLAPRTHKMQFEATLPAISTDLNRVALCTKHTGRSDVLIYAIPYAWRNGSSSPATPNETDELTPTYAMPLTKSQDTAPESITSLRWVTQDDKALQPTRLVALATTSAHPVDEDVDTPPPAASGRIVMVDTDLVQTTGSPRKVIINFDEMPQESLGDDHMDFDREVSLIRSRTQAVRRRSSVHSTSRGVSRSSTSLGHRAGPNGLLLPSDVSESSLTRRHSLSSIHSEDTENSFGALVLPVDEPYSQQQPRSNFSLQRAATISAQSGASRRHLLALPNTPLEFRRADGSRGQFIVPHESDADNWVPPPPPYSRDVDATHSQPMPGMPPPHGGPLNTAVPDMPAAAVAHAPPVVRRSPSEQAMSLHTRAAPPAIAMPARRPLPASATVLVPPMNNTPPPHQALSITTAAPFPQHATTRSISGSQPSTPITHPASLLPGVPDPSTPQEYYAPPTIAQPRPSSPRTYTTTTAPRTAQYRGPQTPPPGQSPQERISPTIPEPMSASALPPMAQSSPVDSLTHHSSSLHNGPSPTSIRSSQRITAQDLARPLPPLPQENAPPVSSRLANVVTISRGGAERDPHGRSGHVAEREPKIKKKGVRCVVM